MLRGHLAVIREFTELIGSLRSVLLTINASYDDMHLSPALVTLTLLRNSSPVNRSPRPRPLSLDWIPEIIKISPTPLG